MSAVACAPHPRSTLGRALQRWRRARESAGVARERRRLAAELERLVDEARPASLFASYLPPAARPDVVSACAIQAGELTDILRDTRRALNVELLAEVERALTQGGRSPLYGDDPAAASAAVAALVRHARMEA